MGTLVDIIHAMSVTEHAKVDQWVDNEHDVLEALYWRQGFDTRTSELSVSDLAISFGSCDHN